MDLEVIGQNAKEYTFGWKGQGNTLYIDVDDCNYLEIIKSKVIISVANIIC